MDQQVTGVRQPTVRDVLGVPALPPARATGLANLGRSWLARLHRGLAPPPARIMEAALAGLHLAVPVALCRLGVPERLVGPVTVVGLADELEVDADRLRRLLRFGHVHGWVRLDRRDRVRPTRLTAYLRADHPAGWRDWLLFAAGPEVAGALGALSDGLRAEGSAFARVNGREFFDWMAAQPTAHARFDAAMAAGARMHALLLARAVDWSASRRVCDIGGGDGTLLAVLVGEHPHLEGLVLELPEVVARSPTRRGVTAVPGDAFEAVPPGCDTYLFVNVLHDWDDAAAIRLLQRAAGAAGATPGTSPPPRVVVVEGQARAQPIDDLSLRTDVLMLGLTPGGRERTAQELVALGAQAGLTRQQTRPLASGALALTFGLTTPSIGTNGQ